MTTVSQLITDAFRQSNLVAIGQSPTSAQQEEGLRYLNRLMRSVLGHEVGDPLTSFPIGDENYSRPSTYPGYSTEPDAEWFVPKNVRLVCNLSQSLSLYLHPAPDDGSRFAITDVNQSFENYPVTLNGNGHQIEGTTSIELTTNGLEAEWFYRADLADWLRCDTLTLEATFPFPEEFDDYFITMLAMRMNPSYGATLDGQSQALMSRSSKQLRARKRLN